MKKRFAFFLSISFAFLISCNDPTIACFTFSPSSAITTATPVIFNASCSEETSYFTWNFGDGTDDILVTSPNITYQYANAGTYIVKLSAKRKDGYPPKKSKFATSQAITVQ